MKSKKTLLISITILAVAVAAVLFFRHDKETIIEDEAFEIPFNKQGDLAFLSAANSDTISLIDIEIADNNQRRARGLMFRKSLPADAGMLFIFDREEMQSFWMKNTYISLDILFVNTENRIVTIHANTTPLREWNYASTQPAMYVVEVNAGYCKRNGINEGDKIRFDY